MTTARGEAQAFALSTWHSATATGRAHKLIEIIDKRFAELREKEKEGCTQVGSSSRSLSGPCSETSFDGGQIKIDDWEPTEEQAGDIAESHAFGTVAHIVRAAMKEGRRIAREDQCSNTSSAVSSPRVSFSSATTSTEAERTAVATKPVAPTESSTPSPKSGAKSLDERAEALFAANPEWRKPPSTDWQIKRMSKMWYWTYQQSSIRVDEPHLILLAALLPRAIERWWCGSRHIESSSSVFGWKLTRAFSSGPPRDLESAIRVLEGA